MSERKPLTDEQMDGIWKEMLKPDAKKPPRLDRSAWEPCGCCKEKRCPTCKYDDCIPIFDPCDSCVDGSGWKPVYKFCPECGRPMTDAAWEMLEKRLEKL